MASSYTTRLRTELINTGEQANSWGNTTNNNFSNIFDEAISAVYSKDLGSESSPYTLTYGQGPVTQANNEDRQAAIRFHGHNSAFVIQQESTPQLHDRIYIIINDGTGSGTIQLKLEGTSTVSEIIPPGGRAVIATDGTSFYTILSSGASNKNWRTITAATDNVFSGENLLVNTTSNTITLTLPGSMGAANVGEEIRFMDLAGTFDSNALTIARNGANIYGAASDLTVSTEDAAFSLVYTGTAQGWKITEK